jgi:poly-gamma-glutamate synthesis protein (capsule biosynthesis protein)
MIGDLRIADDGAVEAGFVPCWIDDDARPVPLGERDGGFVVEYVEAITGEAGLETAYSWDGDRVVCR